MQHFLEARSLSLGNDSGGRVLSDVSCRFGSGELSVVTGQNGSGKTALLRALRGLEKSDEGKVLFDARTVGFRDADLARHIAFIPQNPLSAIVGPTVRSDLLLSIAGTTEATRNEALAELLRIFMLEPYADRKCIELPHSTLRLHTIACALAGEPVFVLADDPFAGLDPAATKIVLKQFLALKERGCAVIVATQDLDRILAHADHLVLMKDGRNIADALPERVLPFLEAHGVRKPAAKLRDMTWLNP